MRRVSTIIAGLFVVSLAASPMLWAAGTVVRAGVPGARAAGPWNSLGVAPVKPAAQGRVPPLSDPAAARGAQENVGDQRLWHRRYGRYGSGTGTTGSGSGSPGSGTGGASSSR